MNWGDALKLRKGREGQLVSRTSSGRDHKFLDWQICKTVFDKELYVTYDYMAFILFPLSTKQLRNQAVYIYPRSVLIVSVSNNAINIFFYFKFQYRAVESCCAGKSSSERTRVICTVHEFQGEGGPSWEWKKHDRQ